MSNERRWVLMVILTLLCSGCAQRFSDRAQAIVRGANRVEIFRIKPERPKADPGRKMIGGHPIISEGKFLGRDYIARLAAVLLGRGVSRNYKDCAPKPIIAYRISKGTEVMEVLVDFQCDILRYHIVGEGGSIDDPANAMDFSFAHEEMVNLAKAPFPSDLEIQSLPLKPPQ